MARSLVIALSAALLAAGQSQAAEIEGVRFPEVYERAGSELRLQGMGLLRYRVLFRGYVAGLYLGRGAEPQQVLQENVPRRLEIEYFWSIPAEAFAEITLESIEERVDAQTFARLRGPIEQLNALYRDIEPGDRYALTYIPGLGTELGLNGQPLGVVEGSEFAMALFGIWLGERPLDIGLRDRLLQRG